MAGQPSNKWFDILAYFFIALCLIFVSSSILWLTVEMWRRILNG